MQAHEYANLFPMMSDAELNTLIDDMKSNGYDQSSPIITYQGMILDGRNRYRAAAEASVSPSIEEYKGNDPLAFVIRHNLNRRHLNESQRAVVASRLANMTREDVVKAGGYARQQTANLQSAGKVSQDRAAEMLNVSPRSVATIKAVERAAPELIEKIERGEMSAHRAMREVKQNEYKNRPAASIPDNKYRVIYADPPWKYGNTMPDNFGEQADHYNLLSVSEIAALPIKELAEDNAVLFLWVTSPILEEAFEVVNAWGFKYKSSFIWDKVKHVMGHYNSVRHEILLVCVRGSCQPDVKKLFDSVYSEERTEHSVKPNFFRDVIDTIYPNGKRIELFARCPAAGWEVWGNDKNVSK